MYREPATNLYRDLHSHIAEILLDQGFPTDVAPCRKTCGEGLSSTVSGVCFEEPEPFDVISKPSGAKLAGAAMKRTQSGILIQGSLSMQDLPGLSPEAFEKEFGRALSRWLNADRVKFTGTLPVDRLKEEHERFSSPEWNQKR
jgi:lipoate-protein ligase A